MKILRPIHPNAGLEASYRQRLSAMIDTMHKSVVYWITACWRSNEPILAQDEAPAATLQRVIRALTRRWNKNFNEAAQELGRYFAQDIEKRSSTALKHILAKAGFTVKFTMNEPMRDVMNATIGAQVGLIKSIPQHYLGQVQQAVMRSVQTGRDLEGLTKDIRNIYAVSRKRAAFIARDQSNKATASMTRARQLDLGIQRGIWLHSHAGKEPRPTHVANNGKPFDLEEGWLDPAIHRRIWPGTEPNCRCIWKPVIEEIGVG